MKKITNIAIYSLHPITYQTPIFREMQEQIDSKNLPYKFEVLFGDDLSLKEVYYEHLKKKVKFDNDLYLDKFSHNFMKNYASDPRKGFFSRINPSIFSRIYKGKHDVVMIHGYETLTAWITLFSAKLLFKKVIFRGEAVLEGNPYMPGLIQKIKRIILPIFFKLCDAVMYSCQGNKNYFKFFGVSEDKLYLLPCAVNNNFFIKKKLSLTPLVNETKKEFGVDPDHFVILFSARFTKRKRPLDLIEAVKKLDNKDVTIIFAGDGPERSSMEEAVNKAGISAIFTGFLDPDSLAKCYSIADLDIVISSKDPSPKSMNEAMVFSLPVIVTNVVGTAHDLVKDGKNGFIVDVGDIDSIANKISKLTNRPELVKSMGSYSFDIIGDWTIEAGAESIFNVTKKLTGYVE